MELSESRVTQSDHKDYQHNALHICAENAIACKCNLYRLQSVKSNFYSIAAIDKFPKNVSAHRIWEVLNRHKIEAGRLAGVLDVKSNARLMLTVNADLQD